MDNKQQYWEQLTGQVSEKENIGARGKQIDEQEQKQHFESWETFWGRPGNGAPRDSSQKENLMKMLHYPEDSNKVGIIYMISLNKFQIKAENVETILTLQFFKSMKIILF